MDGAFKPLRLRSAAAGGFSLAWAAASERARLTRAELLRRAGAAAIAVDALGRPHVASAAPPVPRRGGTIRLGVSGSSRDVVDAHYVGSRADEARLAATWEPLATFDAGFRLRFDGLAEELAARSPDTWTIRVRRGVEFHDGRPLTADDVAYTLRRLTNAGLGLLATRSLAAIDPRRIEKLDRYTLRLFLRHPDVMLPYALAQPWCGVVPVGYSPRSRGSARPNVGTGPFKLVSFSPGGRSVHARNENYWRDGEPYLDRLVVVDIPDDTARVNALLAGQVDAIVDVPARLLPVVRRGQGTAVLVSPGGYWPAISMRVDTPPFGDVRVRKAFRLIADRSQLVRQALAGAGRIGNDVYGIYDELSNASLPQRRQDLDQARWLLARAGRTGLAVELVTTALLPGMNEGAEVFARQARAAGVDIRVRVLDISAWYGNYTKWPFSTDAFYTAQKYLIQVANTSLPSAPFNATHWPDRERRRRFVALWNQARSTLDIAKRRELVHEMQKLEYEAGGFLIWGFADQLDGYRSNVQGLQPRFRGRFALAGYGQGFRRLWLE